MANVLIATGVVAVVVLGFGAQNRAMLAAGAERTLRPVVDGMVAIISGALVLFALALGILQFFSAWVSSAAMIIASLLLALSGLGRYVAAPGEQIPGEVAEAGTPEQQAFKPDTTALPLLHFKSAESWAVAFFLAGAAGNGSVSLAAAFVGLTVLTAFGLSLWAMAGWSGCQYLSSGWHRRHLDWGFGILMFVAAIASLAPAA